MNRVPLLLLGIGAAAVFSSACPETVNRSPPAGWLAEVTGVTSANAHLVLGMLPGSGKEQVMRFPGAVVETFDVSDPRKPVLGSDYVVGQGCGVFTCGSILVQGTDGYVASLGTLTRYAPSNWQSPPRFIGQAGIASVPGGLLAGAESNPDQADELDVISTTGAVPQIVARVPETVGNVWSAGSNAYLITTSNGPVLDEFNVNSLANPTRRARRPLLSPPDWNGWVGPPFVSEGGAVDGTSLYFLMLGPTNAPGFGFTNYGCRVGWYSLLDTSSSPTQPLAIGDDSMGGCWTLAAHGSYVFVGVWYPLGSPQTFAPRLVVFRADAGQGMVRVSSVPLPNLPSDIAVDAAFGVVAVDLGDRLELYDYGVLTSGTARWP